MSTAPLREPSRVGARNPFVLPAVIVSATVLIVGIGGLVIWNSSRSANSRSEVGAVAQHAPAASDTARPSRVAAVQAPAVAVAEAQPQSPSPSTAVGQGEAVSGAQTPQAASPAAQGTEASQSAATGAAGSEGATPTPVEAKKVEAVDPSSRSREESTSRRTQGRDERSSRQRSDDSESRRSKTTAKAKKQPEPLPEPEVVTSGGNAEDDLLGGRGLRRRTVAAEPTGLPAQLDDSDILGGMRKHRGDIANCLKKQSAADARLDGVMTVNFVIERTGHTRKIEISPEKFGSSVVGRCVVNSVKGWTFPQFTGRPMPVDFPVRVKGQ